MLVLSRHTNEALRIGHDIRIVVVEFPAPGKVRLGIEAPADCPVHREEVYLDMIRNDEFRSLAGGDD